MKTALFVVFCACLMSCTKDSEIVPEIAPKRHGRATWLTKDVRTPKQGIYEGQGSVILHSDSALINKAFRTIRYTSDSTVTIQWWSNPDTAILVDVADTLRYVYTSDQTNTSCGEQRTIYDYTSTGFVRNDTLFESGTVRYRWYYYGQLRKELNGTWESWVKFKRTIKD